MPKKNHISPIYLLLTALLLTLCQQERFEVELPSSDQAIASGSALERELLKVSRLDGSFDNVLDNASCLSVKLPVRVRVNGTFRVLSTRADVQDLVEFFDDRVRSRRYLQLEYPVTILTASHEEVTVDNSIELAGFANRCQEMGQDNDNECVDFVFPVPISTYDPLNQRARTIELGSDRELYRFLDQRSENELIALVFPVTLQNKQGDLLTVESHQELEILLVETEDSCDENDEEFYRDEIMTQFGRLQLAITDAPFPAGLIEEAKITIAGVEIKAPEEIDSVEFISLSEDTLEINLLELNNGITEELSNVELPAGVYPFINLNIIAATVLTVEGEIFELRVPSGRIKITGGDGIVIESQVEQSYLLDFDVSRSFVVQGNPDSPAGINGFLFKPVIKLADLDESGTIAGMVKTTDDRGLENVQISLFAGDTLNTTSFSQDDGSFKILGLEPGIYTLLAELAEYQSTEINSVEVSKNEEIEVQVVLQE